MLRMVLLYSEGDSDDPTVVDDYTISITALKKSGSHLLMVTAENLKTGEVFTSPKDNAKILEILPMEFWPAFVHMSLLVGPPDGQCTLF